MRSRLLAALAAALIVAAWGLPPDAARAQTGSGSTGAVPSATQRPERVTINRISVEGVPKQSTRNFVRRISGLSKGQQITLPGGDAVGEAIRAIYRSGLFSDVSVARGEPAEQGGGVHLVIRVAPEPGLAGYSFRGVDDNTKDDLREEITLAQGRPVRPADIQRAEQAIRSFYSSEGYLLADVQTRRQRTSGDQVRLVFDVDTGQEVEVEDIRFTGNRVFDDGDLRGAMQETQEDRWWRFWTSAQFDREKYEADLDRVIDYYNREGYYDATIVDDTTYVEGEENLIAEVRVREGDQYHVRNVEWRGNTVYPDEVLTQALGFGEGDVYNSRQLQRNLRSNRAANDVTSLYTDRGYVRFNVEPTVQPARGDSLDLTFNITEGDVYEVGNVKITGNTKTKDYVIRRELHTVPGRTFSRSDIKDSIRRLQQLGYFSKESIRSGPSLSVDQENRKVDMVWSVEEVSNDQLELSGTYGGYGLVLQTSFTFNNFSAQNLFDLSEWQPLPVGDGQKLSLSVRTAGLDYQNYRVSFTEPWFRGQPTPVGGSISYARITGNYLGGRRRRRFGNAGPENAGIFQRFGVRAFRRQRLDWPDDNFRISSTVNYNYYRNDDRIYGSLPGGVSQQLSFKQGISRNSLDNPLFPSRGSKVKFSLEVAPPLADIQFHKWRFTNGWNVPLSQDGKLSFHVGTDYGYIGSLTGEDVDFQAFELGGTAFDYSRQSFGTDPIFMRGYPARSLNPVNAQNEFAPGRILNKYTSEVRYLAVDTRQLRAAPYLFLDAANTWAGFDTYDPSSLYRSAGVGAKLYLPIVGMIEVNYGYNFDRFPSENVVNGQRVLEDQGWRFQISFGGKRGS